MNTNTRSDMPIGSMDRRGFLKFAGAASIAIAGAPGWLGAANKDAKPKNILIIATDQQHIDTIAASGCGDVKTPALDRLKERGFSFKLSYTNNPVCSPARAAIFTGRTSSETGVYKNGIPVRTPIPNLGQWLSEKTGYETVYAGKWHVPSTFTTFIPGFKVITTGIGGQGNVCDTNISKACRAYLQNRSKARGLLMVASFLQPHDICEWLRINTEVPDEFRYPEIANDLPELPDNFEYDTNEPEQISRTRRSREGARGNWTKQHWRYYRWSYYRHIEIVDAEIGRLLDSLDDFGYAGDTMIILTSDHGEGMGHHQWVRKSTLYDEGVSVPLLISWPRHIGLDKTNSNDLVSGLDIMPTICDYVGIEPPANMRGESLRGILEGKTGLEREFIVSESNSNAGRMVRTKRYKYISYVEDPVEQLFDMENDPGETKNLAGVKRYASALREHRQILHEWESSLDVAPNVPDVDLWRRQLQSRARA